MDEDAEMIFHQTRKIQLFHSDAKGRITLSALCRFAQESAGGHAHRLGVGMERLAEQNIAWVLREQALHVERYPALGEEVVISTWPTRTERILCHRDYRICDQSGRLAAWGTNVWFGLDLAARRPRKAESFFHLSAELMPDPVFDQPLLPLLPPGEDCHSEIRTVRASDLDALGHMNNLRYLDWIADHLSLFGLAAPAKFLRIRHAMEVKAGDRVEVRHAEEPHGEALIQMRHADLGKEVCLARVVLQQETCSA